MEIKNKIRRILFKAMHNENNAVEITTYRIMKIIKESGKNDIHSMEQFQQKYFPNQVGVDCPYCGRKLET